MEWKIENYYYDLFDLMWLINSTLFFLYFFPFFPFPSFSHSFYIYLSSISPFFSFISFPSLISSFYFCSPSYHPFSRPFPSFSPPFFPPPGRSYNYEYSATTNTDHLALSEKGASVTITAQAHIDVTAPCEHTLRVSIQRSGMILLYVFLSYPHFLWCVFLYPLASVILSSFSVLLPHPLLWKDL